MVIMVNAMWVGYEEGDADPGWTYIKTIKRVFANEEDAIAWKKARKQLAKTEWEPSRDIVLVEFVD
jgi:hypothetical protein